MAFTAKFSHIAGVEIAGEVDVDWDDAALEIYADEIRIYVPNGEDFVLRRNVPGIHGELFDGFEPHLLDTCRDLSDVKDMYRAAARRELGERHLMRELL